MAAALTPEHLYFFHEGTDFRLYHKFGAHPEADGTRFRVWAPAAEQVRLLGGESRPLERREAGIWEAFVPGVVPGARYAFQIVSGAGAVTKADPFAFYAETPPKTWSVVWDLAYQWGDRQWMSERLRRTWRDQPVSIYELHLGSWRRRDGRPLSYRELAEPLAAYVGEMGFTHVEFMPVMEHPSERSWGYHVTGYFAPTSRYGSPQDFMALIDHLHQRGIGVILDWVPAHFARDEHGLGRFDGTPLFEQGFNPEWNSYVFHYGRPEVRSFLLSSAVFWLDLYHADALRVDGVAPILDNPDGPAFLRKLNETVYGCCPGAETIAEDSSARPMVSQPTYAGGIGFGFKWDMGWMHDTLEYMSQDPIQRKHYHHRLTFRSVYAFNENYVLPLSHDEVKPGFGSLAGKMPGDESQKLANLRLLLAYMYAQPGKKLLFMGGEFGQLREWDHAAALDWELVEQPAHAGIRNLTGTLNWLQKSEPALHERDTEPAGFEWIDFGDVEQSVISFLRRGHGSVILAVFNFTPVPRFNYRIGVPGGGLWREILNTDGRQYGGAGFGNLGGAEATPVPWHGRMHSVNLTLPPLGALYLKPAA